MCLPEKYRRQNKLGHVMSLHGLPHPNDAVEDSDVTQMQQQVNKDGLSHRVTPSTPRIVCEMII